MRTADAPIGVRHRAKANDKTGLTEIVISSRPKPPTAGAASIIGTRGRISRKGTGSVRNLRSDEGIDKSSKTVKRDLAIEGKRSEAITPEIIEPLTYNGLVGELGELFLKAKRKVATAINEALVITYWRMGKYIVEYEQCGADRAKYGSELLKTLSFDLRARYGRGFNRNNLQYMRKLYRAFPKCTTLSCKLTWSHYLEILKADDEDKYGFFKVCVEMK